MKKVLLIFFIFSFSLYCQGQEANYSAHADKIHYIYVGSLPKSSVHVYEKLKIEIFGGNYGSTDLSTTIYSIATRDVNRLTVERAGGGTIQNLRMFELVIYENGNYYDFVIQTFKERRYISLNIKSTFLCGAHNAVTEKKNVEIGIYDPTGKKNVTSDFLQTVLTATDSNGNFGIGTLTPKAKLDVRGNIIADQVEIKVNTGADFVFDSNYKLQSLPELENFVKTNKHLPDIPSEKEMQNNGINLNEMQIKLLQKIEELTLYMIELNKKNEEQEKLIKDLQEKLEDLSQR